MSGFTQRDKSWTDSGCRFIKGGGGNGRVYVFHNTFLRPRIGGADRGVSEGIIGGGIVNYVSRNNLFDCPKKCINVSNCGANDFAYDICGDGSNCTIPNGSLNTTPIFNSYDPNNHDNVLSTGKADFSLKSTSPGYNQGLVLNNFNDGYFGLAPDTGAHEAGTPPMEFGVDAYRTPQPSPSPGPSPTPTPILSPTPTPTPGDYVIYEAEGASLTSAQVESEHLGYTGSGYVNFLTLSGARISWNNLSVSSGGNYNLTFRYALGVADRAIEMRVNGNIVASSLNFPSTNAWTNWSTLNLVVPLNPGNNTLEAITIGSDGPNIDHLRVPTSPSPIILLFPGWNEIAWPAVSGKKASDTPSECLLAVSKESVWFKPYVKNFGGINFDFVNGKTYYLYCTQALTWTP